MNRIKSQNLRYYILRAPLIIGLLCISFYQTAYSQVNQYEHEIRMSEKAKIYTTQNKHKFVPEYVAPAAVSLKQLMKNYPLKDTYVAFSLQRAEQLIKEHNSKNWREVYPEIYSLGGINTISGAVYDYTNNDLIIVGKYDSTRQPLTLDDLAVALRACMIHKEWPLVSIDPTDKTYQTGLQKVRFEGGIENTQFGADLLDADYRMKLIGFDLIDSGVEGFINEWEETQKSYSSGNNPCDEIYTRYWFQPVVSQSSFRDGIALIDGNLRIGLFIEVMAAQNNGVKVSVDETITNSIADKFAREMTNRFSEFSEAHPSFSRMWGLQEITALAAAIRDMDEQLDLGYWLKRFKVKEVGTAKTIQLIGRKSVELRSEGGAQLTAIAMRLQIGDVSALREAVLTVRPSKQTLSWGFSFDGQWIIPIRYEDAELDASDIGMLYAQTMLFMEQRRFDQAIICAKRLVKVLPESRYEAYQIIGKAFEGKGLKDAAMYYYSKSLEFDNYSKTKQQMEKTND